MIALACLLLFGSQPVMTSGIEEPLENRVAAMQRAGQDVDSKLIEKVAELQTQDSLDALIQFYGGKLGPYAQGAVLRSLKSYSADDDVAVPALDFLVAQATTAPRASVRVAAVETIGKFSVLGRGYLWALIGLPAPEATRLRALVMHSQRADEDDYKRYRDLANIDAGSSKKGPGRKSKRLNDGKGEVVRPVSLRRLAFQVAAETFATRELIPFYDREDDHQLKVSILNELVRREHQPAAKFAKDMLQSGRYASDSRTAAAKALWTLRGKRSYKDIFEVATAGNNPVSLRSNLAAIIAESPDFNGKAKLAKRINRGSVPEQLFTLQALFGYQDAGAVVKARKTLESSNPRLLAAAVRYLGSAGQVDDIAVLEQIFQTATRRDVISASMEALVGLKGKDQDWVEELAEYARGMDPVRAPLAIVELAKYGMAGDASLFLDLLGHSAWATRLAALEVLVARRELAFLGPIIAQMQHESGRMLKEFEDGLFELTGQLFGTRSTAWKAWYSDQGRKLPLLDEAGSAEARRLRAAREAREQTEVARFFDIEIESERVIFIIDISGSMAENLRGRYENEVGEPRIERAKSELIKAIQSMRPTGQFNIIAFSSGVSRWSDRSVGAEEAPAREAAVEWISGLGARGGTNLYGALSLAFNDSYVDTIVLLSDGEPSVGSLVDPGDIRRAIAQRNEGRRVVIHSIALGSPLRTLEWLSLDSGGTYAAHMR